MRNYLLHLIGLALGTATFLSTADVVHAKVKESAAVSLGDSYITGEAGRWRGNSNTFEGDRAGTDRAHYFDGTDHYDNNLVYRGGPNNICHRSDTAEIESAPLEVDTKINLACSGAETVNIFRAEKGGVTYKGQPPQADQLATVARTKRVKLIVLSIGGNDSGFSTIAKRCVVSYLSYPVFGKNPCYWTANHDVERNLSTAEIGVEKSISEIRAVMRTAGYKRQSYRFVLQGYMSPVPLADEVRYPEDITRLTLGGCPLYNEDLNWTAGIYIRKLNAMLYGVAQQQGVEFLDVSSTLHGHEACSKGSRLATPERPANPKTSEWVRFLVLTDYTQGNRDESLHPNAYGQMALGNCLGQLSKRIPEAGHSCFSRPRLGPTEVVTRSLNRDAVSPPPKVTPPEKREGLLEWLINLPGSG